MLLKDFWKRPWEETWHVIAGYFWQAMELAESKDLPGSQVFSPHQLQWQKPKVELQIILRQPKGKLGIRSTNKTKAYMNSSWILSPAQPIACTLLWWEMGNQTDSKRYFNLPPLRLPSCQQILSKMACVEGQKEGESGPGKGAGSGMNDNHWEPAILAQGNSSTVFALQGDLQKGPQVPMCH